MPDDIDRAGRSIPRLAGARILMLDDEEKARSSLERPLDAQGAEVECFESVEDVLSVLPLYEFDAAVVDYWLPGRHGTDVVKALRGGSRPCASIVITGTQDPSLTEECVALGAEAVLIKPFELDAFLDAVHDCVRRTRIWRKAIDEGPTAHVGDRRFRTHGDPLLSRAVAPPGVELRSELVRNAARVARDFRLSDREEEMLFRLLSGDRSEVIAERMGVAVRTVKYHVGNILKKTGLRGRSHLILFVLDYAPKDGTK